MTKILNFTIKILVIYFQISICDRKIEKPQVKPKSRMKVTNILIMCQE
jgi:hypothetical protein